MRRRSASSTSAWSGQQGLARTHRPGKTIALTVALAQVELAQQRAAAGQAEQRRRAQRLEPDQPQLPEQRAAFHDLRDAVVRHRPAPVQHEGRELRAVPNRSPAARAEPVALCEVERLQAWARQQQRLHPLVVQVEPFAKRERLERRA